MLGRKYLRKELRKTARPEKDKLDSQKRTGEKASNRKFKGKQHVNLPKTIVLYLLGALHVATATRARARHTAKVVFIFQLFFYYLLIGPFMVVRIL